MIHGDRELAYYGDLETGEHLDEPVHDGAAGDIAWRHAHWIWYVDKVGSLVAGRRHAQTFFCGGSRNSHRFIDLFDEVFVLEIDLDTLNRRLADRPKDEFSGRLDERALIERLHATRVDIPEIGVSIDAAAPLDSSN